MNEKKLLKDQIKTLLETPFLNVYDLQSAPGKHYFEASRRKADSIIAQKDDITFKKLLPDAVTCCVILNFNGEQLLLLDYEYRIVTGHYLLSPPAGLIDKEDQKNEKPIIHAAVREIKEETGLSVMPEDRVSVVSPLLFSSPGMTDESNALVCAVIERDVQDELTQDGAVGGELFDGFRLVDKATAKLLLEKGRDLNENFYSLYTWAVLMWFISEMWK